MCTLSVLSQWQLCRCSNDPLSKSLELLQNPCGACPDSQPLSICTYGNFVDVRVTSFLPRLPLKFLYTSETDLLYTPPQDIRTRRPLRTLLQKFLQSLPCSQALSICTSAVLFQSDSFADIRMAYFLPRLSLKLLYALETDLLCTPPCYTSIQTPLLCPNTIIKCNEKTIGNTSADGCSSEIPRRQYQNNLILTCVWEE